MKFIFIILMLLQSFAFAEEKLPSKKELLNDFTNDIVIGNKSAEIQIIEYASLSCSHCASFHNNTFKDLKEAYIDTGKVKFIYRHFPLDKSALDAAMLVSCSGSDNFHRYLKAIFATQSNWLGKKNYIEILENIAKLGGMTGAEFQNCIANKEISDSILKGSYNASKVLDVNSTPTFFLNGEKLRGAISFEELSKKIEEQL